jgi:hypothetical protein
LLDRFEGLGAAVERCWFSGGALPLPDCGVDGDIIVASIAAGQPMLAKEPLVAGPADGRPRGGSRKFCFGVGGVLARLVGAIQDDLDFLHLKPGQADFEIDVDKGLQFQGENLPVPPGLCGDRVIGNQIGPLLRRGEMTDAKRRHLGEAKKFGRRHSAVTSNDLSSVIDKDGRHKAEGFDAIRDLADLCAGMLARIFLAGRELRHRDHFETPIGTANNVGDRRCGARAGVVSIPSFHFLVTSVCSLKPSQRG